MGFVLAASGSAIGLGNVVFFPANAYRYGGGGFYLPYLVALVVIGIPLMILELGLGHQERRAYPAALRRVAGARGEFLGWWALVNTSLITFYYVAILGWVMGMVLGALGPLWTSSTSLDGFTAGQLPNPSGYFFHLVSSALPLFLVALVWAQNAYIVRGGAATIERAVRIFVPAMWVLMLLMLVRGVTLDGGVDGVWSLFAPDFAAMRNPSVWQGAISQIFFTLSIGFGVLTAYGSYLPRRSDQANNALLISFLNCGFEYIAGIALFAILFVFAAVPQASTLSMTFFIVPQGIAQLPGGPWVVTAFGLLFFLLLLMAGLSSTASMVESTVAALIDKLGWRRRPTVYGVCALGALGSAFFALPAIVDPAIQGNGTLGLTLLDLVDHWAFSYGLLLVGLSQCLLLGRLHRIRPLRSRIDAASRWPLGRWYEALIGIVLPIVLAAILVGAVVGEVRGGLYGASYAEHYTTGWQWLRAAPLAALAAWLLLPTGVAWALTRLPAVQEDGAS